MEAKTPYGERFHHRMSGLGALLLMLPVLLWVWQAAREPVISVFNGAVPRFILSGRIFSEPFNIIHAGHYMDQPTIFKWLFWFTFMTASSLPYAAAVGWLSNRTKMSAYLAYLIGAGMLGVFLLCILSWPFSWMIQYVSSMGFTVRRMLGLLYMGGGMMLVLGFIYWAIPRPKRGETKP